MDIFMDILLDFPNVIQYDIIKRSIVGKSEELIKNHSSSTT